MSGRRGPAITPRGTESRTSPRSPQSPVGPGPRTLARRFHYFLDRIRGRTRAWRPLPVRVRAPSDPRRPRSACPAHACRASPILRALPSHWPIRCRRGRHARHGGAGQARGGSTEPARRVICGHSGVSGEAGQAVAGVVAGVEEEAPVAARDRLAVAARVLDVVDPRPQHPLPTTACFGA
jgi:hypothetical protein